MKYPNFKSVVLPVNLQLSLISKLVILYVGYFLIDIFRSFLSLIDRTVVSFKGGKRGGTTCSKGQDEAMGHTWGTGSTR